MHNRQTHASNEFSRFSFCILKKKIKKIGWADEQTGFMKTPSASRVGCGRKHHPPISCFHFVYGGRYTYIGMVKAEKDLRQRKW